MQRDPAIVPLESDVTIVQCVRTGGAGQLRGNVLSRWGHSSYPVRENGKSWAVNIMESAFSRFIFCASFLVIFAIFRSRSRDFFRRLWHRTKCSDGSGSGSGRNVPPQATEPLLRLRIPDSDIIVIKVPYSLEHHCIAHTATYLPYAFLLFVFWLLPAFVFLLLVSFSAL